MLVGGEAASGMLSMLAIERDELDVWLWPENEEVFGLFASVCTQWRVGPSGAYGLDYGVLYPLLDRGEAEMWDEHFALIRHMEQAALRKMKDSDHVGH